LDDRAGQALKPHTDLVLIAAATSMKYRSNWIAKLVTTERKLLPAFDFQGQAVDKSFASRF